MLPYVAASTTLNNIGTSPAQEVRPRSDNVDRSHRSPGQHHHVDDQQQQRQKPPIKRSPATTAFSPPSSPTAINFQVTIGPSSGGGRGVKKINPHDFDGLSPLAAKFYAENGYLWDWVMVVRLKDYRSVPPSTLSVLEAMSKAGLVLEGEFDQEGLYLFIKIAASKQRLDRHANVIEFPMLADPICLQKIAHDGVPMSSEINREIKPFTLGQDPAITKYTPYEWIYLEYVQAEPKKRWFYCQSGKGSPFRAVHRLKLIKSILISSHVEGDSCAGINLRGLQSAGVIDAFFPLHDKQRIEDLEKNWIYAPLSFPWNLPLNKIRAYFGEKITLYFAFVGHYATWSIIPAIVGFVPFIYIYREDFQPSGYSHPVVGIFGALIFIWAIVMLEFWKRKEKSLALKWGMFGFEAQEQERPEYKGELKLSLVSDRLEKQYPVVYYRLKLGTSISIITLMVGLVIAAVTAIFVFRWAVERTRAAKYAATYASFPNAIRIAVLNAISAKYAATYASLLNAIQIVVLNAVYSSLAQYLTKWENHRTDTQHEDALIVKLFAFRFVNSYASMIYIAFIQNLAFIACALFVYLSFTSLVYYQPYQSSYPCLDDNCMGMLANNLTTIFITRLISGNIAGVVIPFCTVWYQRRQEERKEGHEFTEMEKQFRLTHYDPILDLLYDYANIAVTYGYAILFVIANPIVPFLALVSSYIEIRGDGFKMFRITRRPEPGGVEDIGTWQPVFTFITMVSVTTNSALICFQTTSFSTESINPFWLFYLLQVLGFGLCYLFAALIPDVPLPVDLQIKRTIFWRDKVILQVVEEKEDEQEGPSMYQPTSLEDILPEGWKNGAETARSPRAMKLLSKMHQHASSFSSSTKSIDAIDVMAVVINAPVA